MRSRHGIVGGGLSLPTLSSEERLRRAPFLTVLMTHNHGVWASRSIACWSREYSGSILLSDVLSPLREVRTQATDVEMSRWAPASDGGLARSTDSGVHRLQMADGRDGRGVLRRTFRPKSSGSALLSDAPPPPREEQTLRAGGHALTPGRADRRAPDTRPAGAGDGPAPTPHPRQK